MDRIIIDVREPEEYAAGHVSGAVNVPPDELLSGPKQLIDVPKNVEIILYCRSGSRSAVAKNILAKLGFTNVINGVNKDRVEARFKGEA